MSEASAAALFIGSLVLTALASAVLAKRLDQVAFHVGASAGLTGLITALAADSPEIASAISALTSGRHDLGLGVIFGSNIFNLAALLGLSALVAGPISCPRPTLILNAGSAIAVTAIVIAQRLYGLPTAITGGLLAAVAIPYVTLSALKPSDLARMHIPSIFTNAFRSAVIGTEVKTSEGPPPRAPAPIDMIAIAPLLAAVVLASLGLVRSATVLGAHWGWSDLTVGALVIASLTGVPNLITALRLAAQDRGAAVVSEAYNSNSLNLIFGAFLPTLFLPLTVLSPMGYFAMWWMAGATVLSATLLLRTSRFGRLGGFVLVANWVGFALIVAMR